MSHPRRQLYPPLKMAEPAPVVEARPSEDQAKMDALCTRLANGELSKDAAPEVFGSLTSMYRAMERYPELRRAYDMARQQQAHWWAEESISVIDAEPDVQRARLKSEARRWMASKLAPKSYGDALNLNVSGEINFLEAITEATRRSIRDLPPVIDAEVIPNDSDPEFPGFLR